ncbi:MAG: RHS repeat-associated core domain-containing protein, partial [Ktedonobacteraceae bacterium]|nr:RHS repeat-associated core domain-containing protein [Ktedonobacteraceae bacterium]
MAGTATYDAYGRVLTQTGTLTPFGYAGQYSDAATGLQYLRARYYDPATQQFLTVDPL